MVRFTPIYGFDVSVTDEVGILLDTSTANTKYDCFYRCAINPVCKMASLKLNQCKLYSQVRYSVQLYPTSDPCLFAKSNPDYSAITACLTNWWPFNNDLKDAITGQSLSNGASFSFTTDRLNTVNSAIYFNNGYLKAPNGVYFNGDFTVSLWIKVRSATGYNRVIDFGNGPDSDNVVLSMSGGSSARPCNYFFVNFKYLYTVYIKCKGI